MISWIWFVVATVTGAGGGAASILSQKVARFRAAQGRWPWWLLAMAVGSALVVAVGALFLVSRLVLSTGILARLPWLVAAARWVYNMISTWWNDLAEAWND